MAESMRTCMVDLQASMELLAASLWALLASQAGVQARVRIADPWCHCPQHESSMHGATHHRMCPGMRYSFPSFGGGPSGGMTAGCGAGAEAATADGAPGGMGGAEGTLLSRCRTMSKGSVRDEGDVAWCALGPAKGWLRCVLVLASELQEPREAASCRQGTPVMAPVVAVVVVLLPVGPAGPVQGVMQWPLKGVARAAVAAPAAWAASCWRAHALPLWLAGTGGHSRAASACLSSNGASIPASEATGHEWQSPLPAPSPRSKLCRATLSASPRDSEAHCWYSTWKELLALPAWLQLWGMGCSMALALAARDAPSSLGRCCAQLR